VPADEDPTQAERGPATGAEQSPSTENDERIAPLRGAGVQIDGRRVAAIVLGIVLVTLAVLAVVFTVVGYNKNDQIDQLRNHGVAVAVTITSCQGLLGGSGSNGAGYSCRGTYRLDGNRYNEQLPGTALYAPGKVVHALAVPGDPALVSPVSVIDAEHSSATVYILPAVFLVLFVAILAVVLLRRRHKPAGGDGPG